MVALWGGGGFLWARCPCRLRQAITANFKRNFVCSNCLRVFRAKFNFARSSSEMKSPVLPELALGSTGVLMHAWTCKIDSIPESPDISPFPGEQIILTC